MEFDELKNCHLCPKNCGVNRYKQLGFCKSSADLYVSYYSLHMWEEPIISGKHGSGAIFFSNCNLKCIFCQNRKISNDGYGKKISLDRLSNIMLELQEKGAHNINLVTPTHYVPLIKYSINSIKDKLSIPVVYNTSSYENVEIIKMMNGIVNIYLADFKYYDNKLGKRYSNCDNYRECAINSIDEMYKQVGKFVIKDDLMVSGLIVRVLVLPGHIDDSKKIIKYLYEKYGDNIIISIMNQYTPLFHIEKYENLNRKVNDSEYDEIINYACDIGVKHAFIQEGDTQKESFIPDFDISVL
ncbi:MAG: radical SAM protein [Bacilli bacterium]|nr:radical SAM protein [Bacilli bacterium]